LSSVYRGPLSIQHPRIFCVASQKGGTGKTTTAVNLAAALAIFEKQTLLVDCDPLGNATTGVGIDKGSISCSLYHALVGAARARDVIVDTTLDYLQIMPARIDLLRAEAQTKGKSTGAVMRRMLRDLAWDYDYIIIDSPPSLGFLTISAMASADFLILPLQYQIFSFEGLSQLLMVVKKLRNSINPELKIAGILFTMCDHTPATGQSNETATLSRIQHKIFQTRIPWDTLLAEAANHTKPAALLDMMSEGANAHMKLAQELMDTVGDA